MRLLLLHIMLLAVVAASGQVLPLDSVQRIDTVEVNSSRVEIIPYVTAYQYQQLDSAYNVYYQSTTLGEVLQENTGIYIKSYGAGALATTGFRGMGASQTKVLWNGIPMNSGMNGTIDLTNLPVALFEDVSVTLGGSSLLSASGSFGGNVSLGSVTPLFEPSLKVLAGYDGGSFGEHNAMVKLTGGNNKIQAKSGFIYRRAKNNFPFNNTTLFSEPIQRQEHAEFNQLAAMLEAYTLSGISKFAFQAFVSKTERNIPPTMLSANAFQSQYDWLAMGRLGWAATLNKQNVLNAAITYKFDEINFTSVLPPIDSRSQTHNVTARANHVKSFYKGTILHSTIEHTSQWAITNNFDGIKYMPITAGMVSFQQPFKKNKLVLLLILRQELVYSKLSPFLPSLSVRYSPLKKYHFYLYTNIFRNYRYPTLNDRYWAIGGNPDLQQEKGWGAEGKVGYDKSFKKGLKLESSVNGYYLDVRNWILWLPESSTGIWTPENVRRVKSRGVEVLLKLDGKKNDWTYRLTANYHFNKATNETDGGIQGASSGKILIYTPQHLGNVSGTAGYKGYYIQYRQHLCGKRYITSDNSQSLEAFTTGDVRIGKDFGKKLKGLSLYVAAENLWNAQYQNIAWRPMPGRSFSGGIRYEFKIENSKLKN